MFNPEKRQFDEFELWNGERDIEKRIERLKNGILPETPKFESPFPKAESIIFNNLSRVREEDLNKLSPLAREVVERAKKLRGNL